MSSLNKIFIIAPCLSMGGMERASVNLANSLNDQGFEVVFLSLFKKEHFFSLNSSIELLEPEGFNVYSLSLLKSILWIRKEIIYNKPTHVLAFNKFYGAITAFSLIGIKIPFFITERSSPLFKWKQPFRLINRIAYYLKPPTGVTAQTKIAADYQFKYYQKSKITVIPNALRDVILFPEISRENIVLAVGRLGDHLKGFDRLISAFALIKNKEWQLVIAGGDEDGNYLKKRAVKLNVLHRIQFLGRVKEIDKIYAQAGIFVIPSRSEGFPNALCEAMAAGLPCISFDFIAGPRDIITDRYDGKIVENNNIAALANAIDSLIENDYERLRLGTNAMQIRKRLKMEKIGQEYLDFILSNNYE